MGARKTKHDYRDPGSFERCEEAAIALADVDTEDDVAYHRARARFRAAVLAFKFTPARRQRQAPPEQEALRFRNMTTRHCKTSEQ